MADQLADEQVIEFRNVYKSFCKDEIHPLPTSMLGTVLRKLGYYPSQVELDSLISEFDAEGVGWIEQSSFYEIMARKIKEPVVSEEDIRSAFRVFDRKGNGFVSAEEMRHILLELGDGFSEEEMTEFLKYAMADEDGQVHYEDFISRMMPKSAQQPQRR